MNAIAFALRRGLEDLIVPIVVAGIAAYATIKAAHIEFGDDNEEDDKTRKDHCCGGCQRCCPADRRKPDPKQTKPPIPPADGKQGGGMGAPGGGL